MMTRAEIVKVLEGIADILQIRGDQPGKVKAYRWAARALDTIQEDIQLLYERNELANIPGVGGSILEKIKELISTGQCEYYEELKLSIPPGVLDLMSIPGVGPATAAKLYQELNIESLESLQQALDAQKLRNVKGLGKKTEGKIKSGLEALLRYRQQKLMGYVLPIAQVVVDLLSDLEDMKHVSLVGDLRRRTETVKDVRILAAYAGFAAVRDALAGMELVDSVDEVWTDSGGSARLVSDVKFDVKLTSPEEFGASLICLTGSEDHVSGLNIRARELELDDITSFPATWTRGRTEEDIYTALGLPFIVPELREGKGEIQAALTGKLPKLVDIEDIRGDLHVHSTWSDGNETVEAMAEAAQELGYEYIAISDHSISSKIANGLNVERILSKMIEIREINEKFPGIEILMGAEVDILKDGSLDYPDEILEKLDVVIASVHSGFNMDEAAMTNRITKAIENRFVHIISHPTGRLLGKRDPYQVNVNTLIDATAEHNKSLEINAYPDRLDLKDIDARYARERGVMLSINTDAHSAADLGLMIYGIYTARRGWLEGKDVLNALPLTALMDWLRGR